MKRLSGFSGLGWLGSLQPDGDLGSGVHSTYSLAFDGSSGYVSVPDAVPLRLSSGSFTVAAWVLFSADWAGGSNRRIVDKGAWRLLADSASAAIVFDSDGGTVFSTTTSWTGNTWYHIAATYDGSHLAIYVNGSQQASVTASSPADSGAELNIGRLPVFGGQLWNGKLDDIRIYSRALSSGEVSSLVSGRSVTGSLIAYWPFEEGSGTTTGDSSGNGNTGTFNGGVTWSTNHPSQLN